MDGRAEEHYQGDYKYQRADEEIFFILFKEAPPLVIHEKFV